MKDDEMALESQNIGRLAIDGVAAGGVVGSFLSLLPPIAAVLSIVWFSIQIYESKTFQGWLRARRARRIARLRKAIDRLGGGRG
jgi:hypothetical protein